MIRACVVLMTMVLSLCQSARAKDAAVDIRLEWWLDDYAMTQTIVYTPLMIEFWKILQDDIVKDPVHFFRPYDLADRLNESAASPELFPDKTTLTQVFYGYLLDDVEAVFQKTRQDSLLSHLPACDLSLGSLDVLGYIGLARHVSLPLSLFRDDKPLSFLPAQGEAVSVQSMFLDYNAELGEEPMKKIRIVEYNHQDDFIVGLSMQDYNDEVFFAKIPALATFRQTVDYVVDRITQEGQQMFFLPGDQLHLPQLQIALQKEIPELQDNGVQNESKKSWFLSKVVQDYFVKVSAENNMWHAQQLPYMTRNIHMKHLHLNSDRRYFVDKPFLLLLRKQGEAKPYFVAWINDARCLVRRK